jgi:hypothetical protein
MMLRNRSTRFLLALIPLFVLAIPFALFQGAAPAQAISTTLVISQVYGGAAPTGTPTFNRDFVEIFNLSNQAQSLNGLSLQYGSATGSYGAGTNSIVTLPNVTIPAGGYYLVSMSPADVGGGGAIPTPDFTVGADVGMAGGGGKIGLVNGVTAAGCGNTSGTPNPCDTPAELARFVDRVGYGTANEGETAPVVLPGGASAPNTAYLRSGGGCTDTDNNAADFAAVTSPGQTITPRNSATAANVCVAPTETFTATNTPTETATNTPTETATNTPTETATATNTATATDTATVTDTPTVTNTATDGPSPTNTETPTVTNTATDGPSPTNTNTATATGTATATVTGTPPTATRTLTATVTTTAGTATATRTATATVTTTPTNRTIYVPMIRRAVAGGVLVNTGLAERKPVSNSLRAL